MKFSPTARISRNAVIAAAICCTLVGLAPLTSQAHDLDHAPEHAPVLADQTVNYTVPGLGAGSFSPTTSIRATNDLIGPPPLAWSGSSYYYQVLGSTRGFDPAPIVLLSDGSLPPGLSLDITTGAITGTVDADVADGAYRFELTVTNFGKTPTGKLNYLIVVLHP
ncbi:Ig domain-containing protein [Herbiconiux sp. YIM B11900]|uniref:Ig domain-containing protein n=1 Tax=Herbiconiux sp. YIM B11900 TaxID=3404131 RepID=UPI003F8788A5